MLVLNLTGVKKNKTKHAKQYFYEANTEDEGKLQISLEFHRTHVMIRPVTFLSSETPPAVRISGWTFNMKNVNYCEYPEVAHDTSLWYDRSRCTIAFNLQEHRYADFTII